MSRLFLIYMGSLALRSTGIALIALICSWKVRNVAIRHAVWVVVLAAMLLMPAIDNFLPARWVPVRVQQIVSEQRETFPGVSLHPGVILERNSPLAAARLTPPAQIQPFDWWRTAAVLYMLVALAMFGRLMLGYPKIWKLRRAGKSITGANWNETVASLGPRRRIPILLESDAVQVPMTIGFFRPAVILPVSWQDWDDWKLRAVLLHEMAHVRRGDWGIAVMAALAKCAYWMNPLAWFIERKLSELAEHASDDASISCTENTTRYAEILLEFATAAQNGGRFMKRGVAMAQRKIESRIERVLRNPKSGSGSLKFAGWGVVLLLAVPVIYSAAALQVASERVPETIPTQQAVLTTATSLQATTLQSTASPNPTQQSAHAALAQATAEPGSQDAELKKALEQELEIAKIRQGTQVDLVGAELRKLSEELAQKFRSRTQEDLLILESQMRQAEAETEALKSRLGQSTTTPESAQSAHPRLLQLQAVQRQLAARLAQAQATIPKPENPLNATQPQKSLIDLPDNEADLRAYLEELARRRRNQSSTFFAVSFTGFQGRIVAMKVSGQDFSLECAGCSYFVGDSVVSSAASIPPGPGMQVRLSPDGVDLSLTCRAPLCEIHIESEDGSSTLTRPIPFGAMESIKTSKKISVVITKN